MKNHFERCVLRSVGIWPLAFGLSALMGAIAVSAADAPCKPVFDAITLLVKTPNHQFFTQSSDAPGSLPHAGETISTGKVTYILHDGKWQTSPMTPADTLKRDEENRKNSKTNCRLLRDATVDGVSTSLYTLHSQSEYGASDGQIWISKTSALPLRQSIDLAVDGTTGKTHIETRFFYSAVTAPPGVK
jgi:hypothetical protein